MLIVGMADGDFLYKFLANRAHPFGRWRNDLKYSDVYDWWNCMQVSRYLFMIFNLLLDQCVVILHCISFQVPIYNSKFWKSNYCLNSELIMR